MVEGFEIVGRLGSFLVSRAIFSRKRKALRQAALSAGLRHVRSQARFLLRIGRFLGLTGFSLVVKE